MCCALRFASPKDANSSSSSDDGASAAKKLPTIVRALITEARAADLGSFGADGRVTLGPLSLEPGTGRGDADLEIVFTWAPGTAAAATAGISLPSPLPVTFVDQAARTEQERAVRERAEQVRQQRAQEAAQRKTAEAALQAEHNATFEKIRKLEHDDARAWANVAEHARATAVTWDMYSGSYYGKGLLQWPSGGDERHVHDAINKVVILAPTDHLQSLGAHAARRASLARLKALH